MKNFNLLVSTSRFNETNAKAELWFTLLICGDDYPIISTLKFPGLISALTNIKSKKVISKIQKVLEKDPQFFQYILKIVPIDFVCESNNKAITRSVLNNCKPFLKDSDTFKIDLKRRKNENVERVNLIESIAKEINNKVNLENPDITIRIEVLNSFSGISFLEKDEIIRVKNDPLKI